MAISGLEGTVFIDAIVFLRTQAKNVLIVISQVVGYRLKINQDLRNFLSFCVDVSVSRSSEINTLE